MADVWLSGKIVEIRKGNSFGFIIPSVPLPTEGTSGKVIFYFSIVKGPDLINGDEVLFQLKSNERTKPAARVVKRVDWTGDARPKRSRSAVRSQKTGEARPKRAQSTVRGENANITAASAKKDVRPKTRQYSGKTEESEPKGQQPYAPVTKQRNPDERKQATVPRQDRDFKSRITGRILSINVQKNFGHIRPNEELPAGYPQNKDIYFRCDSVENGGLDLEKNDILSFSLGTKDKSKPMALSVTVDRFHPNRSNAQIEDCVHKIKDWCKEEDRHMYKHVSCDAAWQCLGNSTSMTRTTAMELINVLLILQKKLRSLHHRYEHIIRVISTSNLLNPWSGVVKTVIAYEQKHAHEDNLQSVKDFLMVILRAVPEKLSAITCLLKPLLSPDPSSMEHYLYRMLRETTRSIPTDIDDMPWENLPLVPSGKELLMEGTASCQPVRTKGAYDSVEQYMDVYFRLFREDCFSGLKKGVQNLLNGTLDLRDMNVYHSVKLVGLHLTKEDSGLAIAIQVVPLRPVPDWASSSNLMFGNLLCLSVSGSFRDPIWATVGARDVKMLTSKNIIVIELCTESNAMSDSDAIIQLSHGSGNITLAESPTYYRAYQPVLKALQKMQPEDFPFTDELVETDADVQPPKYFLGSTTADTRILHDSKGKKEEVLLDVIGLHPKHSILDPSQYDALYKAIIRRIAVIQGPPGTGKTFIGIKLVDLILSMSTVPQAPIIVLTYKNHALDEFMKDLMKKFPGHVARVGGRCKETSLEQCNLATLRKDTKKSGKLHILMSEKYREIDEAKPAVKREARALDKACHYSHDVLYRYATPQQVMSLLVGCNWKQSTLAKQSQITLSKVRQYIEASMNYNTDICLFLQSEQSDERAQVLQKLLLALIEEAMQHWYPNQTVVRQVEMALGIVTPLDLTFSIEQITKLKEASPNDVQQQDERDIEDMEKERLATVSTKRLNTDEIIEFRGLSSTNNIPRLFSTSKAFVAQLPQAQLMNVMSLWELTAVDRVKYIQCLLLKNFEEPKEALEDALAEYQRVSAAKNELNVQHSVEVLEKKKVIGMTITGASIHRSLLSALQPAIVLVEEAAEVLEPQLIAALGESVQHLILIGDHKQLRPPVESYELTRNCHFDVSMMERLINNELPFSTLLLQNRMRPEFAKLLKDIYPDLRDNTERVLKNAAPVCMEKSMYFWSHSSPEEDDRSYWNEDEAERAVKLCLFFLQQGYAPPKVTILAAYGGQTTLIRQKMRKEEEKHAHLFPIEVTDDHDDDDEEDSGEVKRQRVEIHTIDMYQGDENEIVIISLVRSNDRNNIGFLRLMNRRCVAQSRARCGMYFLGNIHTLCSAKNWKKLISSMKKVNTVGPTLTLRCPKHPESTIKATRAEDITLSSFCKIICNEMRQCGIHRCKQFCQPSHSHDTCNVPIAFRFEKCRHVCKKPCSKPVEAMVCTHPCRQLMDCRRHLCHQACGDEHSHSYCAEREEFTYKRCGHTNTKHCSQEETMIKCEKDVEFSHPVCRHLVKKLCYEEDGSVVCKKPCIEKLSCGHQCNNKCGKPCTQANDCKSCIKIRKEEEKKRVEIEKKAMAEFKEKLAEELKELEKNPMSPAAVHRTDLDPEGDHASEYYEVEDRVKKYVQLKHKWFPEVRKIEKVGNYRLYKAYLQTASNLQDPRRQMLLFHGTSTDAVEKIVKDGFIVPKTAGMFGRGIYFATDSSKSAQKIYTKGSNILLLCEVKLGKCMTVDQDRSDMDSVMLRKRGYDSLYAKRNTKSKGGVLFDEYVVYNPAQAIVKYIVHYECASFPTSQEHLEKFDLLGAEKTFTKHVLRATRGRQLQGSTLDTHFRMAESQFLRLTKERSLPLSLTEVHYFVKPQLVERFKEKAEKFRAKYGKSEASEYVLAWHGTKQENIDKIVHENFRLDMLAAATGVRGSYGAGIYFSEFPDVSLAYGSQILLCMVLLGKTYDAKRSERAVLKGQPCQAGYDSHRVEADKEGRGKELVIFNADQILPCYVVNYVKDSK